MRVRFVPIRGKIEGVVGTGGAEDATARTAVMLRKRLFRLSYI